MMRRGGAAEARGATPLQAALARLLQRASNILLTPGTSSLDHLCENIPAAELGLPGDAVRMPDGVAAE